MTPSEIARGLRKIQTPQEEKLWNHLRNRKLCDFKFRRQFPVTFEIMKKPHCYIADFCCLETKLVIELDGSIHQHTVDYDLVREAVIKNLHFTIIRFTNDEIENSIVSVLKRIYEKSQELKPTPSPLP